MTTYYHPQSGGFYLDEVHGPRTIIVSDPDWIAPVQRIADPQWTGPKNKAPMIEVIDPTAYAPMIEVPNPSCSLPAVSELVVISVERYASLLEAQSAGEIIQPDAKGFPVSKARAPLSQDVLISRERQWRDSVLLTTDALVVRHRDELEAERPTSLSADQYRELQGFRLALRDWTEAASFPDSSKRPVEPDWLENGLVKAATA